MKPIALIAIAAILSIAAFCHRAAAQNTPVYDPKIDNLSYPAVTVLSTSEPWSIIGQWHYAGPAWRGMIDIRPDGTFSRVGDGQSGKWKLAAEDDHFVLILKWDHSAEETVAFISPTLFQGNTSKGDIKIRRLPQVQG